MYWYVNDGPINYNTNERKRNIIPCKFCLKERVFEAVHENRKKNKFASLPLKCIQNSVDTLTKEYYALPPVLTSDIR